MPEGLPLHVRSPNDPHEPFVFVCYSHEDLERIESLIGLLNADGIQLWIDRGIRAGTFWRNEIAEALDRATHLLFFVSRASLDSEHCEGEVLDSLNQRKTVIPVFLDEVGLSPGLRLALGRVQALPASRMSNEMLHQELRRAIRGDRVGAANKPEPVLPPSPKRFGRLLPHRTTAAGIALAMLLFGAWLIERAWHEAAALREQRATAIEEATALIKRDDYGAAFVRLRPFVDEAKESQDSELGGLWRQVVSPMKPLVAEPGASVFFKPYQNPDGEWLPAGTSPIEQWVDAPRGVLRMRIEKPGYATGEFVVANPGPSVETGDVEVNALKQFNNIAPLPLTLSRDGEIPPGMVRVPATDLPAPLVGLSLDFVGPNQAVPAFAIARAEVTNREFKEFVDAQGYANPAYWSGLHFTDEGKPLTWAEARKRMVDQTGRAAPSGWELGSFSAGQAEIPVGGISWYEAVAYARFRNLALPTVHHWARAATAPFDALFSVTPSIAMASRMSADGPIAETADTGVGPWGTVNSAGNVREWVFNSVDGSALTMGGGWSDPVELAVTVFPTAPFDRSPQNGVRLMQHLDPAQVDETLLAPVRLAFRETDLPTPISDETFDSIRFQFTAAARTPTRVSNQIVAETDAWTSTEVTLEFANAESFTIFILEPRIQARLQPILYAPGAAAASAPRPNRDALSETREVDFIVRGGRALVIPIWAGTFERFAPTPQEPAAFATYQRERMLDWHRDLTMTLDYLSSRSELDMDRVGIAGFSQGARLVVEPLLAIEGRLKAAVLISGGLQVGYPFEPIFDAVNYAPRTFQPVLMINGRYDNVVPFAAQQHYFDLLGTPPKDKRLIAFPCGHIDFPRNLVAKEVADFLDQYLGPVMPKAR